jgi:hypothetical protein
MLKGEEVNNSNLESTLGRPIEWDLCRKIFIETNAV